MCRKVRQKVNGEWRYIRSCAFLGEPGLESSIGSGRDERYCIHRTGTYNIHVEYCTCRYEKTCYLGTYYIIFHNKTGYRSLFFQILWKSRCDILVSFPFHLKKLRSILRF